MERIRTIAALTLIIAISHCISGRFSDIYNFAYAQSNNGISFEPNIEQSIEPSAESYSDPSAKNSTRDKAIKAYKEFLNGDRNLGVFEWDPGVVYDIDSITTPKGEPNKHYHTQYAMFDSNGDDIPELHVKSARYYDIFTYINDDMAVWQGMDRYVTALENGLFLCHTPYGGYNTEQFFAVDYYGEKTMEMVFSRGPDYLSPFSDIGGYEITVYLVNNIDVPKEIYDALREPYDSIEEIDWIVLYEDQIYP